MIALQNFVVFCQTSTWISHRYTYIPSLLNLPPTPLGWYRAPVWVSWAIQQIPVGYLFSIWYCKFPCYSFHTSHPLLPSPHVHKSILYVCFSISALKINSSVTFLSFTHVCIRKLYLSFSCWLISLCIIGSRFILIRTDSNVFLFIAEWYSIVYMYHKILYPFISWWTSRLLPCSNYHK